MDSTVEPERINTAHIFFRRNVLIIVGFDVEYLVFRQDTAGLKPAAFQEVPAFLAGEKFNRDTVVKGADLQLLPFFGVGNLNIQFAEPRDAKLAREIVKSIAFIQFNALFGAAVDRDVKIVIDLGAGLRLDIKAFIDLDGALRQAKF